MATKKKLLQAAAGSAGGAALNVEEVFSTYLYEGTATSVSHQIQNGIDLAGEGGLVWIKKRDSNISNTNHHLVDTERGDYYLASNSTNAQASGSDINTFNSDGWTFDASTGLGTDYNGSDYASWTFRKAPKFFDVVKYQGNNESAQYVNHNLGVTPGCIILKSLDSSGPWFVWHRGLTSTSYALRLNTTAAESVDTNYEIGINASDTQFYVDTGSDINYSTNNYIAYLFAHNDGDGDFGPTGDQDIIKCGSYTGDGAIDGPEVTLGFEPQWLLIKRSDATGDWRLVDVMRGMAGSNSGNQVALKANASEAESAENVLIPTPTGWKVNTNSGIFNAELGNYIYVAIRRGPMAVPESATDVFAIDTRGSSSGEPGFKSGFVIDTFIDKIADSGTSGFAMSSRLTQGKFLQTNSTSAEGTQSSYQFDYMNGFGTSTGTNADYYAWMWRRAPNYFDVVAYTGTNVAGLTVDHNLGVVPEMIWVKNRSAAEYWAVYHKDLNGGTNPSHYFLKLNDTNAETDYNEIWNDTEPTDTQFTVGQQGVVNGFEQNHIAYLFASVSGVSKVGSYTSDGTNGKVIDCGFTSGARFVLIKGASVATNWLLWDSERGIVAGNDPFLELNTTDVEDTGTDYIDPHSSGFIVNSGINFGTNTFIFYAIA